jgi:hypothetical protein
MWFLLELSWGWWFFAASILADRHLLINIFSFLVWEIIKWTWRTLWTVLMFIRECLHCRLLKRQEWLMSPREFLMRHKSLRIPKLRFPWVSSVEKSPSVIIHPEKQE